MRGFTLIEALIYCGLVSLLLAGTIPLFAMLQDTAVQIAREAQQLTASTTAREADDSGIHMLD